jgi:large subunit ribosomal protein L29
MNAVEIRKLSDAEIASKLSDTREELMKLRFQKVTAQLTDTNRLVVLRRQLARMETILKERARAAAQEGEA